MAQISLGFRVAVKRAHEGQLVHGEDQDVAHGADELIEKFKVDFGFIRGLRGHLKLLLQPLRDGHRVVRLCRKLTDCDLALILFDNLLE